MLREEKRMAFKIFSVRIHPFRKIYVPVLLKENEKKKKRSITIGLGPVGCVDSVWET
jgi:hypothetical protein